MKKRIIAVIACIIMLACTIIPAMPAKADTTPEISVPTKEQVPGISFTVTAYPQLYVFRTTNTFTIKVTKDSELICEASTNYTGVNAIKFSCTIEEAGTYTVTGYRTIGSGTVATQAKTVTVSEKSDVSVSSVISPASYKDAVYVKNLPMNVEFQAMNIPEGAESAMVRVRIKHDGKWLGSKYYRDLTKANNLQTYSFNYTPKDSGTYYFYFVTYINGTKYGYKKVTVKVVSASNLKNYKPGINLWADARLQTLSIYLKNIGNPTGFILYRSTSENGTYSKVKAFKGLETTQKSSCSTNYYYKIRTYAKINGTVYYSDYSYPVKIAPVLRATMKSVTRNEDNLTITWEAPSGDVYCYDIYRKIGDGEYTRCGNEDSTARTYEDKFIKYNVSETTRVYYRVVAYTKTEENGNYSLTEGKFSNYRSFNYVVE